MGSPQFTHSHKEQHYPIEQTFPPERREGRVLRLYSFFFVSPFSELSPSTLLQLHKD